VPLSKVAWLVTVVVCVLAGGLLVLLDYYGYGATMFVVALSAAINLR
jgi:hypothetical protein